MSERLPVIDAMAGNPSQLPTAELTLPEMRRAVAVPTAALVFAGGVSTVAGLTSGARRAEAADPPSSVTMTAECADFNGDGTPEVRSSFHFTDTQNRIALDRSNQTTITWDIIWKGIRNSDPENPSSTDRVNDFGNITDLVKPYDPAIVTANPEYVDGIQQYDAVITHTMPMPNSSDIVNPDGSFVVQSGLRNYEGEGVISTVSTTVDCTPNPTSVDPAGTPPASGPANTLPTCERLEPEMALTLKHLGKKSNRWLLGVKVTAAGQGRIIAKGNSADKKPAKAKKAAGFTLHSSTPIKTISKKTQRQVGNSVRIDLLKNVSEGSVVKFNVPFTTKNSKALPKVSMLFKAPRGTVVETCNSQTTVTAKSKSR